MRERRRKARNRRTPRTTGPRCTACGRVFDLASVPSVTVLDVQRVESPPKLEVEDWFARDDRRDAPAKSLPALVKARSMVAYAKKLTSLIGKRVAPLDLRPAWSRRDAWPSIPRVPGVVSQPSDDWTYWTLVFGEEWARRRPEATFVITAAIGGHSLGSRFGPVTIEVAPILRVRVHAHLTIDKGGRP